MNDTYLGDGLYASFDGYYLQLYTDRGNGRHYVALEPEVFQALLNYAYTLRWLRTDKEITA